MTKELYLDLIRNCLLNTIYEDPDIGHTEFSSSLRENGLAWPSKAHTMIGNRRMRNIQNATETVLQEGIPGDLIETGVWRGGACIFMQAILKAWGVTDRTVWVADSFEGLPKPSRVEDAGDRHHEFRELAVSLEEVQSNFQKYNLLDDQVRFLKGWFSDTLASAPIDKLSVLRLDGDMYSSTMDAFDALYHRVSPGGFVIIDDYGAVPACKHAVGDFRTKNNITATIIDIDNSSVFWRVPALAGI